MPDARVRLPLLLALLAVAILWASIRWLGVVRIEAPRPAETADSLPQTELGPSVLTVPIRIQLETLVQEVEEAVPVTWGSLERRIRRPDDDRTSVAVALSRGPFRASFRGGTVRLSSTVAYRVRAWYDPPVLPEVSVSCGTGEDEPPPRLVATLESPLTLTSEWRLATQARVADVRPATDTDRDRCTVTVFGVDATGRVVDAARGFLEEHGREIDARVAEADVRSSFEEWWAVLRDPIRLDEATWLLLHPEEIHQGRLRGEGDVVEVLATLVARPRVILGLRPLSGLTPLPPLRKGEQEGELEILVEGLAQYGTVSRRLASRMEGFRVRRAGREVEITSPRLSGIGGGRVALEVETRGDVKGKLFLVGTPVYDPTTRYASVPDLEFAVETSDLLVRSASWIVDPQVENLLRQRARWRVAPALEWVAEKLHEGLNRELADGVRLQGSVEQIRILGVAARKDGVVVRAAASADATLFIETKAGGARP